MKKLILLFIPLLFLSCKSEQERAIDNYFSQNLKDPESFKIYKLETVEDEGTKKKFLLDYGAKNGFGAMSRETVYVTVIGDEVYSVENYLMDESDAMQVAEETAARIDSAAAAAADY